MSSTLSNWRATADTLYVYEPNERWRVRLLEPAITPIDGGRQWSVRLYHDGTLRNTIVADAARRSAARHEMVTWLREHPVIISGERADE